MSTALIVEDTATQLEILASCLQRGGFTTITATSSEDAKTKLSSQKPDVIILDVVLPGQSGFELCRDIKAEASTSHIPIVICSTKSGEMDRFWGLKQGAAAYIGKPIDQEELLRTVKQVLKG